MKVARVRQVYEIEGGGIAKIDEAGCLINNILSRLSKAEVGDLARIFRKHKPKIASLRPDLKDAFRDASQHLSPKTIEKLLDDTDNVMLEKWAKLNKIANCPLSRSLSSCAAGPSATNECVQIRDFLKNAFESTVGKNGDKAILAKLEGDIIKTDGTINTDLLDFFKKKPENFRVWNGLIDAPDWGECSLNCVWV